MEKGINLSLTNSLVDFDELLRKAIAAVNVKNLSVAHAFDESDSWKFQVGQYVHIETETEEDETGLFWIGFGWKQKQPRLWLEFDAATSQPAHWDKVNKLVGTSGVYYTNADFEFVQSEMNAWAHVYLKDDLLQRFYDENTGIEAQMEILTGFITEVMAKL